MSFRIFDRLSMPMFGSLGMKLIDHLTSAAMGSRQNKTCGGSKLQELQTPKAKRLSEWHTDW